MKKLLLFALFLGMVQITFGQAEEAAPLSKETDVKATKGFVTWDSRYTYLMLEPVQNLRKVDVLLNEKKNGEIEEGNLIIWASLISILDYQSSNTDSKFAYLMRHPTSNNQIGKTASEAVVHSAQLSLTGTVTNWLTLYTEILYDPEQSFGAGTITALTRNQLQLRKGYVLIGDLDKVPVYLAVGQMGSVNPFTNSTMWHAFGGLGYGALLGFDKGGFNASFMAIQGGAQFRALHVPVEGTNVPSRLNNFGFDANYTFKMGQKNRLRLGGSYLHGTAYCQGFPVFHFMPCEENNPALTAYAALDINNRFYLKGGFAKTADVWSGTFNPTPPLNEFEASKVSSLDIGAKYNFPAKGKVQYSLSAEFSNFVAGPDGAPWERQTQTVLGFSGLVKNSSKLFVEVFRTTGYAPLNWISGGNFEDLGVTHSDADARSVGIVIGGMITI